MKKYLFLFLGLFIISPLFAAYNTWGIPDSSEIRSELQERWFEADLATVRENKPETYLNDAGQKFQIRLEEVENAFYIFVSPATKLKVKIFTNEGERTEEQEFFPGDNPGSWVLIRDKKTGKPIHIRWYFMENSEVYVQFSPHKKTCLADMVIFDSYVARGIPTGVPFSLFYKASFQEMLKVTENILPWKYVTIDSNAYHSIKQIGNVIQENLPTIRYIPDAMYDENYTLVRISDGQPFDIYNYYLERGDIPFGSNSFHEYKNLYLSSAGFVKWIADGLVEPIAGNGLNRAPLILETTSVKENGYQGVLSEQYSLSFSLNWIRNLASAVISVYTSKTYLFNEAGVDVNITPFSMTNNVISFVEDSGYNPAVLKTLFYLLAATDPETFYFGAIRETDRSVVPEIKTFNDCVVFLPYFDSNHLFNCFVFMNGKSFTLDDFCRLYQDSFVYLTRVRANDDFYPLSINSAESEN